MRIRGPFLASILTALAVATSASAAEAAPPSYVVLPAEQPRKVWYGWQTLTIAGASLGVGTVPAVFFGVHVYAWPPALTGMVLSGPIVHWKHGRVGRGFAVLGMNLGITGTALGLSLPVGCIFEKCDGFYFQYMLAMSYVGAAIGVGIDAAFLSTYEPPEPHTARRATSMVESLVPVIDVRPGHTVFGVAGAF
ncbi:hypothetical protein [Polyangium jinanense]|uniref:Uncharacterized protein n=1 Tax=Polyangium jinanense TaxID=2829994 RepID=A0A9X3XBX8_9BACT|nr:hypothetical protein [Polyangium jinanense]MDC3961863.1 hypothetical protein [Polyangium jinanense]MDC3987819.1 hypothetical protein [Polyangium jinanense]